MLQDKPNMQPSGNLDLQPGDNVNKMAYTVESRVEDDYPHESRGTWHTYSSAN